MSEMVNEFLSSPVGTALLVALAKKRQALTDSVLMAARSPDHSIENIRYKAGMADGMELAINTIIEMGK